MKSKKLVAYIGSYTSDGDNGLVVCDVDNGDAFLTVRETFPVSNVSYMCKSPDGEILYAVVDEGVAAFKIGEDGNLTYLNTKPINGMRGRYIICDSKRRYVFVAGFHDGKVTMLKLKKDGSVSGIADSVFHRGHAISANERRLDHPKVSSVCLSPEEEFLCATDYGLNQMRLYKIDYDKGTLTPSEIVRCSLDSAPRNAAFSKDGKFCYILTESANAIEVYTYVLKNDIPTFERIQVEHTIENPYVVAASVHMHYSEDDSHIFTSIDGMNYISWFLRDKKTGMIKRCTQTPVSGDYPKFITLRPGSDDVVICNHDLGEIRQYHLYFKDNYMLNNRPPVKLPRANCLIFTEIK